jgi:hypothetical protein
LELPISSKTGEPLKPFIKPGGTLLLGITFIALGFYNLWRSYSWEPFPIFTNFTNFLLFICFLVEGCLLIYRAKLGMGFVFSIIFWSIPGLLGMVYGTLIIIASTLVSPILCLYWLVELEKYKVKN